MSGLQKVLKIYGSMKVQSGGKTVVWVWDYKNDKARLKSEMSKEEIAASERAKWEDIKNHLGSNTSSTTKPHQP